MFSDFPCFWQSWQFWEVLVKGFAKCASTEVCLMFFSWLHWGLCVLGRKNTEVRCVLSTWLVTTDVNLWYLAQVVVLRFLHHNVALPPHPVSISPFLEGRISAWPSLKDSWDTSLRGEYLYQLFEILLQSRFVYSLHLFIYLIICLGKYGFIIYFLSIRW